MRQLWPNLLLRQARLAAALLLCCVSNAPWSWLCAGERLCDELAPELTSLLSQIEMPANFVPVTNTVLSEMQRRGVSRDDIQTVLRKMGQEVPPASVRMLQVGTMGKAGIRWQEGEWGGRWWGRRV